MTTRYVHYSPIGSDSNSVCDMNDDGEPFTSALSLVDCPACKKIAARETALANAKAEHDVALRVAAAARVAREAGFCGAPLCELVRALEDFEAGGEGAPRPSDASALAERLKTGFADADSEDC